MRTNRTPIHKWTSVVWSSDSGQRHWGVCCRLDVRDEISAIQTTHRMRKEVDRATRSLSGQDVVEALRSRGDGACGRDAGDDDLCAELLTHDGEYVRPVLFLKDRERRGSSDVEAVKTYAGLE